MMSQESISKFKFLTIVLAIPLIYVGIQDSASLFFPLAVLVTLGIPHGATDHIVHQFNEGKNAFENAPATFYIKYLSYIAFFFILWLVTPSITLLLFLGLSAYHFGQTQLAYFKLKSRKRQAIAYTAWGASILLLVFGFHLPEVSALLEPFKLIAPLFAPNLKLVYMLLAGFLVLLFNGLLCLSPTENPKDLRLVFLENVEIAVLALVFSQNGLLVSFCLFFGFWHSLKAFYTEWVEIKQKHPDFTIGKLTVKAVPYSLVSFVGIGVAVWAYSKFNVEVSPLVLIIVMISLISFPHILLFDQFYKKVQQ